MIEELLKEEVRLFVGSHPNRNLTGLARSSGLDPKTIRLWLGNKRSITLRSLDKILDYMESRGKGILVSFVDYEN